MARGVFINEVIGQHNGSYEPRYDITHGGGVIEGAKLTLANPVLTEGTPLNADTLNNLLDFDNLDSMKGNVKTTAFGGGAVIEEIRAKGSSAAHTRRVTTFPTADSVQEETTVFNDAGTAVLRATTVTVTFGETITEEVS